MVVCVGLASSATKRMKMDSEIGRDFNLLQTRRTSVLINRLWMWRGLYPGPPVLPWISSYSAWTSSFVIASLIAPLLSVPTAPGGLHGFGRLLGLGGGNCKLFQDKASTATFTTPAKWVSDILTTYFLQKK